MESFYKQVMAIITTTKNVLIKMTLLWTFLTRFGSLKHFAASAQLNFGSLWLECSSAQLLQLRLPGVLIARNGPNLSVLLEKD